MQTRQWQDQDNQTRYLSEVVANDIIILDPRRDGAVRAADADPAPAYADPAAEPAPPAAAHAAKRGRATSAGESAAGHTRAPSTAPAGRAKSLALPRGTAALEEEDLPF
jgi:single-strand DNA-binding protein